MNKEVISAYIEMNRAFQKQISEELFETYLKSLSDYKQEDIAKAFRKAIKECKFFPSVSEIIEIINRPKVETSKPLELPTIDWSSNPFEKERQDWINGKITKHQFFKIMAEKCVDNFLHEFVPPFIPTPKEHIKEYINARHNKMEMSQKHLTLELNQWMNIFFTAVERYTRDYKSLKEDEQYLSGERLKKLKDKINEYELKSKYLDHVLYKKGLDVLNSDSDYFRNN